MAVVLVVATVALFVAAAVYNDGAAPPAPIEFRARTSTLDGGPQAPAGATITLTGGEVAIGEGYLLDAGAGRFLAADGGASFAANSTAVQDPAAAGHAFAWVEPGSPPVVHVRDFADGTMASFPVPPALEPVPGSLVVGDLQVAWDYIGPAGRVAPAYAPRSTEVVRAVDLPLEGNVSVRATLGRDLFVGQEGAGGRLWAFNTTTEDLEALAGGDGVLDVSAGAGFVAWVNRSLPQAEYFDLAGRLVQSIPAPAGFRPSMVRASLHAVLIAGSQGGLFGDSPRWWHYDFASGDAQLYTDLGVPFDGALAVGLSGHTVVVVEAHALTRESAPLTVYLLGAGVVAMAASVFLAARDVLGGPE